ncbi:MAG: hypothetical protein RIR48_209, partial [Bacteroidota bacterium]
MYKQLLQLCITFLFSLSITSLDAQVKISGNVKSSNNEPMIGASVIENGTNNGTITDVDGNFELLAKDLTSTLKISFIGYQSKMVKIENQSGIMITMEDDAIG